MQKKKPPALAGIVSQKLHDLSCVNMVRNSSLSRRSLRWNPRRRPLTQRYETSSTDNYVMSCLKISKHWTLSSNMSRHSLFATRTSLRDCSPDWKQKKNDLLSSFHPTSSFQKPSQVICLVTVAQCPLRHFPLTVRNQTLPEKKKTVTA